MPPLAEPQSGSPGGSRAKSSEQAKDLRGDASWPFPKARSPATTSHWAGREPAPGGKLPNPGQKLTTLSLSAGCRRTSRCASACLGRFASLPVPTSFVLLKTISNQSHRLSFGYPGTLWFQIPQVAYHQFPCKTYHLINTSKAEVQIQFIYISVMTSQEIQAKLGKELFPVFLTP